MSHDNKPVFVSLMCAGGSAEVAVLRCILSFHDINPAQADPESNAIMYHTTRPDMVESTAVTLAGLVGFGAVQIEHHSQFTNMPEPLVLRRQ